MDLLRFLIFILIYVNNFAQSNSDQLISYGDLVHVSMKEDQEVVYAGEVSTNGFVTLPYLGAINISDLMKKAEKVIKISLEKDLYQKATIVSVVVVKKAIGYIYVYGAVQTPGKIEIPVEGKISISTSYFGGRRFLNGLTLKKLTSLKTTLKTVNLYMNLLTLKPFITTSLVKLIKNYVKMT